MTNHLNRQAEGGEVLPPCPCLRCVTEDVAANPAPKAELMFGVVDPRLSRMFLCAICGNKRCPHSDDHRNACSGSNDPGQPGSRYAKAPSPSPNPTGAS